MSNLPQISDTKASLFKGSPLDFLPCAPSSLFSFFLSNDDAALEEEHQVKNLLACFYTFMSAIFGAQIVCFVSVTKYYAHV